MNCTKCKNAIFCESFGEYKCKKLQRVIPDLPIDCVYWESGEPSKDCHCDTCEQKRAYEVEKTVRKG